jgi:hypothetical protein
MPTTKAGTKKSVRERVQTGGDQGSIRYYARDYARPSDVNCTADHSDVANSRTPAQDEHG